MDLSPEDRAAFTPIIDRILRASNLEQISAKKVRNGLAAALSGRDLSDQKKAINALIHERFDQILPSAEGNQPKTEPDESPAVNGASTRQVNGDKPSAAPSSPLTSNRPSRSGSPTDRETPPKKVKVAQASDAALAARLQAEENSRVRPTRGIDKRKRSSAPKKGDKIKKRKSANKVRAEDDSDLAGESGEEKPKKRNGAFHKPMTLSPPLAALTGETTLSRPQTVKKIWEYVKANNLQNEKDKRQIICDDAMRAVFRSDTVHMFTMNKILSTNLYDADE